MLIHYLLKIKIYLFLQKDDKNLNSFKFNANIFNVKTALLFQSNFFVK